MSYRRGAATERLELRRWEEGGWVVTRSAGSHGAADLVALKAGQSPVLIQVKGDARGAFAGFGPAARRELLEQAGRAGGTALLVHRPPREPRAEYAPALWPPDNGA